MEIADFDKPIANPTKFDEFEPYNSKEFSPCDFKDENDFLKDNLVEHQKMKKILLDNFDEIHARSKKVYSLNRWTDSHMYYDPVSKIIYHYVFDHPVYSELSFYIKNIEFHD